jgi:exopolysaccharide biosynthesis WecB/TagA/CpsF family protein
MSLYSPLLPATPPAQRVNDAKSATSQGPVGALPLPVAVVDGWTINIPNTDHAVFHIIAAAKQRTSFSCVTLNLDHLVKLRVNETFRAAYRSARYVTADGAPVAAMARRANPAFRRTTGADMFMPLVLAAANEGVGIYLYGTSDAVLTRLVALLSLKTGGRLKIKGCQAPSSNLDVDGPEATQAIERIRASGAALCFVMLGAPKQELFSNRAVAAGVRCGFINIGAAGDFLAGAQRRAPLTMQKLGLEWLWRLGSNPRRLGPRYLACALLMGELTLSRTLRRERKKKRIA